MYRLLFPFPTYLSLTEGSSDGTKSCGQRKIERQTCKKEGRKRERERGKSLISRVLAPLRFCLNFHSISRDHPAVISFRPVLRARSSTSLLPWSTLRALFILFNAKKDLFQRIVSSLFLFLSFSLVVLLPDGLRHFRSSNYNRLTRTNAKRVEERTEWVPRVYKTIYMRYIPNAIYYHANVYAQHPNCSIRKCKIDNLKGSTLTHSIKFRW